MKTFVLYDNFWWEWDENTDKKCATLINAFGGRNAFIDITNCKTAKAEEFEDLNWNGTDVLNEKFETGWLAPNGDFFGCNYRYHDDQAIYVHKKTESELEQAGWVKLTYMFGRKEEFIALMPSEYIRLLTHKQFNHLKDAQITNYDNFMLIYRAMVEDEENENNKQTQESAGNKKVKDKTHEDLDELQF